MFQSLQARCDLQSVRELGRQAREFLSETGVVRNELDSWEVAMAEAVNNAVTYALPEGRKLPVRMDVWVTTDAVEVRVTDHTLGFEYPPIAQLPPEDSESGRGLFLMQNLTDEVRYLRGTGENCLILRKRRSATTAGEASMALPDPIKELDEARRTLDLMTEELASSYESLSAIFRFSSELPGSGASQAFVERWLNQLLSVTESDWFVLRLLHSAPGSFFVTMASSREGQRRPLDIGGGGPPTESVEGRALAGKSVIGFDSDSPVQPLDPLYPIARVGCGFSHPLLVNNTVLGVLSMGRWAADSLFKSGQVSVAQTFGDFLAVQIRNTQMQEEQVRARLNARELEIAAGIQRSLLPERLPSLPGASLAGFFRSAREIGGDYYDAIVLGEHKFLLVVADVMGKGLPAALFEFMFRSLLRARLDLALHPGQLLSWLNQNLFKELERAEMFVTAQLVLMDCEECEVRVCSAGHPPLLIADSSGKIEEISEGGPPLGILLDAEYPEATGPCCGRYALMFTDGLIEAQNLQGEMLGIDAVRGALSEAAQQGESAEEVRLRLARLLHRFERGRPTGDDVAFLVISP